MGVPQRVLDERRATQVAAFFLKEAGGKMSATKLDKLVYLADREALIKLGYTITKGTHVSLADGPAVCEVHDLLFAKGGKEKQEG